MDEETLMLKAEVASADAHLLGSVMTIIPSGPGMTMPFIDSRTVPSRGGFALCSLITCCLAGCSTAPNSESGLFGRQVDFRTLEFVCSREVDHVPKPTEAAEALFQQAFKAHVDATSGGEANVPLLREAVQGYRKAAEAGHWKAVRNLANLYSTGTGSKGVIKPDEDKALDYVRQLMAMNVATGYNLMAAFANQGWGVRRDPEAALRYERKAADLGDKLAQRHLGQMFVLDFNKLPEDQRVKVVAIGRQMLACAVRQGDKEAAFHLAIHYDVKRNYPYALFYYQQGAKMGDATALLALSDGFKDGDYGYGRDLDRADRYYQVKKRADVREGPFPDLDKELPLPPPPNGGSYPAPEMGWPNEWTQIKPRKS